MSLERKKTELELAKVRTARMELEFKIMEREEDIIRLREHVQVQLKKEAELEKVLKQEI